VKVFAMRRFLSLLSVGFLAIILSGCHTTCQSCNSCNGCNGCGNGCRGGCGLFSGDGHYLGTHGVCDCDLLNPCYNRAPWALVGMGMFPGEIPVSATQPGEEIKVAPKVDKK
jgi:hypothetical protein